MKMTIRDDSVKKRGLEHNSIFAWTERLMAPKLAGRSLVHCSPNHQSWRATSEIQGVYFHAGFYAQRTSFSTFRITPESTWPNDKNSPLAFPA